MKNLLFKISCVLILAACSKSLQAQTVLTGQVTGNSTVTLLEDQRYILRGAYVITSGSTLKIEEGVTVLAEPDAILVVEPGAVANFTGTANKPIVFTSDQGSTSAPGDWVGIRLAGDAETNVGSIQLPNTTATAGGTNTTHNLIQIDYLKIDFAGAADELGQEYALSLIALGNECAINNVMVTNSSNSGFTFAGGAPNVRNAMNNNSLRHGYHFTSGNTSKVQNIADLRTDPALNIQPDAASFLVWNNNLLPDYENLNIGDPYTSPVVSNYTVLHSLFCDDMAENSLDGIRFEQNGRGKFRNGVISGTGANVAGVFINGDQCIALTATGDIVVDYTDFLGNITNARYHFAVNDWDQIPGCSDDVQQWLGESFGGDLGCAMANNNFETSLPDYDESICYTCPLQDPIDYVINSGSPNIANANYTWVSMVDMFFDQSLEFRGAFQEDNNIFNWVDPCPQACPEQKPTSNKDLLNNYGSIKVYPNPVTQELTVSIAGYEGMVNLTLIDLFGRTIIQTAIEGAGNTDLSLQDLPAGSYFLQLSQNGLLIDTRQIAKQ